MPDWFPSDAAAAALFPPLRIVFLLLVASVARYVLHRLIDRTVRQSIGRQPNLRFRAATILAAATSLPQHRREQRIAALGSLARSVVTVVVLLFTAVMVLAEMGFNVSTIIAGTSIIGVTIAFGLQNVVKDFIAGVFMLVEDQLGVGDFVDMEQASGTVEAVGLRVTELRDDHGTVWYVRNGEVVRVGNYSQGGTGRPPVPESEAAPPD